MKLKGVFWKEGINGLGVGPQWMRRLVPYKRKFDLPACAHDRAYDVGGSEADRLRADRALLDVMLSLCTNGTQLLFAAFYYCMVRIFGRLFFRYDE